VDRAAQQVTFEVVNTGTRHAAPDGFDPSQGTSREGHATCLVCNQVADAQYIRSEGQHRRLGQRLLAVIFEQSGTGKAYRTASAQDLAIFEDAQQRLLRILAVQPAATPTETIPLMTGLTRSL